METEATKITRGDGASPIQYDIKFHFSGPGILFNPENIIEVIPGHFVYKREWETIQNYLLDEDKVWSDVKELKYICGLRAPYHLHPQGFSSSPCNSVDGYEVYITFKTEAKYYKPSLEEFKIGFECEIQMLSFEKYWKKIILYAEFNENGWDSNVDDLLLGIQDGYLGVRVKYLDAEDLRSLGFVFAKENGETAFVKSIDPRNDWTISLGEDNKVFIDRNTDTCLTAIPSKKETWECIPVFRGRIKNKSALEQVLKMIGVQ